MAAAPHFLFSGALILALAVSFAILTTKEMPTTEQVSNQAKHMHVQQIQRYTWAGHLQDLSRRNICELRKDVHFATTMTAKLVPRGPRMAGCEACHGPGKAMSTAWRQD